MSFNNDVVGHQADICYTNHLKWLQRIVFSNELFCTYPLIIILLWFSCENP